MWARRLASVTRQRFAAVLARAESTTGTRPADVPDLPGVIPELPDVGKGVKEAVAYRKGVKASHKKLNDLCYMVRRMNTTEALAQMQFTQRHYYADIMRDTIRTVVRNAEHNHHMDPKRLVIVRADVGRATPFKRLKFHGRGKFGHMTRPRAHLRIVVREIPKAEGEERLGLRGRKTATIEGKGRANGRREKWARRREEYTHFADFDSNGRPKGSVIADYMRDVQLRESNEREWLKAQRLRIPPTRRTHHNFELRRFLPTDRPLQLNGGYASLMGKGERQSLATGSQDDAAFGGVSEHLRKAIERARLARQARQDAEK